MARGKGVISRAGSGVEGGGGVPVKVEKIKYAKVDTRWLHQAGECHRRRLGGVLKMG
jgi:hypothetical protein